MGRQGRFERGAVLAWAVDVDRGYREAAGVEWSFADLRGRPGAEGLPVADVVGQDLAGPEVSAEPLEDGKIRFRADSPLVIQAYGEERPSREGPSVDVPYGSVVRAGSLLLAPLYAEQLESVREGRMSLPVVPLVSGVPSSDGGDDDDLDAALRLRQVVSGRWSVAWALAFVAGPFIAWGLTYQSAVELQREYAYWHFDTSAAVAFIIAQLVSVLCVGLPLQVSMSRWKRTPGTSKELAPPCAEGGKVAVAALSATLVALPWLLGFLTLTVINATCANPSYHPRFMEWAGMSAALGVIMSIAYCIFAFVASGRIHPFVVRWLAAAPRDTPDT